MSAQGPIARHVRPPAALAAALALACTVAPFAAPAARAARLEFRPGVPEVRSLPNGLRVAVFRRTRLPIVQIMLLVPAGVADEPEGGDGLANATAQLVTRGTSSRSGGQYAADLDKTGGTISASAGRDYTTLSGSFLTSRFDAGLELMADAVLHPLFTESDVEGFRRQTEQVLLQLDQSPASAAEAALWAATFQGTAYARPLFGTPEGVAGITAAGLQGFHREHWRPDRAVLVIAGDVTDDQAFTAAGEWFGSWSGSGSGARTATPPHGQTRTTSKVVNRPGLPQAEVRVGFVGPPRGAADFTALEIVNQLLGGAFGSRLDLALREGDGLSYDVRTSLTGLGDGSLFAVAGSTRADSVGVVVGRVLAELQRLAAQPPGDAELGAARHALAGSWPLQFERLSAFTSEWVNVDFHHLPVDRLQNYPAHLDAVSAADVAKAIHRWLDPAHATIVVVGPATVVEPQLARFGPVARVGSGSSPPGGAAASRPRAARFIATPAETRAAHVLVARVMAAHGGLAAFRRLEDAVMDGAMTIRSPNGRELTGQFEQVRKEPWKMVMATTFMGFDTQQILDGRHAWSRYAGDSVSVTDADSATVQALRSGFNSDLWHLLLALTRPDTRLAARGTAPVSGHETDVLDALPADGELRRLYFDRVTHRLVAMDQNEDHPGSHTFQARRVYHDYHAVDGMQWPYIEERLLGGQRVMQLSISRIAFNTGVEDAAFRRPPLPETGFHH